MARSNKKNKTPGAGVRELKRWLRGRAELAAASGRPIEDIRCIRTSSSNVTQWEASARTSFAALELLQDPDVILAQSYGMDLVRRDAAGKAKRAELGDAVFPLMMCHAPGGVGSSNIGLLLHVGRTLFVYLLTSARADNLEAENEDRRGNAATELLSEVVRRTFEVGRAHDPTYRPRVHAREHERIVRDERHGTALKETFIACHVIAFIPHRIDMRERGEANTFSFGTLMSAVAVEGLVLGMNRAEVVMQANGGYYAWAAQVPFTHEPTRTTEVDPRTGVTFASTNKHRLAVTAEVDGARALLRTLADALLKDRVDHRGVQKPLPDWAKTADLPEVLALPSRQPYDLMRGITLGQKSLTSRVKSLKSLITDRWIEAWRTGWLTVDVPIKTDLKLDLGDEVEIVAKGDKKYYRCKVAMPVPEGGWGISDDEWNELLRRRYPDKKRTPTTDCHPLAGIGWDDHERDREYRLATRNRYVVESRQLSATATEHGDRIGWQDGPAVRHEATITSTVLHASVAASAREALIGLDAPLAPVVLRHAATIRPAEQATFDVATRESLVEALQDAEDLEEVALSDQQGARVALKKVERTGDAAAITEASRQLDIANKALSRARETRRRAKQELDDYDTNPPATPALPAEQLVDVLTATPEFIVAALEKSPGVGPLWLHTTCSTMFTDWRCRLVRRTGARDRVAWACVLVLEVEGSDDTVLLPLSGEVDSSSNLSGSAAATTVEDWAWRFFYRGQSFAEVGSAAGIDGSGQKNTWLYKSLSEWLTPAVPDRAMRTAAMHCPIPAVRRILWMMVTGDIAALAGIDTAFIGHIETLYGSVAWLPKWSWCRDTHTDGRRVAAALLAADGAHLPVHMLLGEAKLSRQALMATARENGTTTTGEVGRRTPPRAVGYFDKSCRRGAPTVHPDKQQLLLRPCPHDDCPARVAGGRGYASLVLNVPETEQWHGVLCPSCMRLPVKDKRDVRFPADYARPWSGHFGARSTKSGARHQEAWTFVDKAFPDPGPDAPLPDTGALPQTPRPSDAAVARCRPTASLRATALGGRRVLAVALAEGQQAGFNQRLAELGGTQGERVTASLAAVVVGSRRATATPRAVRAAALGLPVLTVTEFAAWKPASSASVPHLA
ncbi:hypothetical protein SAMN05660199_01757 [Klenkia soli]|uniref:Uncharacterized protein n=1 Tax=Klenkia soli TaxID=1052260 RepID=A0A1H0ISP1_9ACTN|nr:hypothetical protein [Klenkia soli]SDO34290.1 hypothetical protein SAMN05660199_01757 [Klenkia soli]